jgi:hypothetical protein
MKPDWAKLTSKFKRHNTTVIAEVDCTADGKELCMAHKIEGYPTLKHGDGGKTKKLETYQGDRSYESLEHFAKSLKPKCTPQKTHWCKKSERKELKRLMALSTEEIEEKLAAAQEAVKAAHKRYRENEDEIQRRYHQLHRPRRGCPELPDERSPAHGSDLQREKSRSGLPCGRGSEGGEGEGIGGERYKGSGGERYEGRGEGRGWSGIVRCVFQIPSWYLSNLVSYCSRLAAKRASSFVKLEQCRFREANSSRARK